MCQQIVINACHGMFSLSHEAFKKYAELKGIQFEYSIENKNEPIHWQPIEGCLMYPCFIPDENDELISSYLHPYNIPRDDPCLIDVVKELGSESHGTPETYLKIVEVPDEIKWQIEENNGFEWISEQHQVWT
jgi:hypothetical protein